MCRIAKTLLYRALETVVTKRQQAFLTLDFCTLALHNDISIS